MKIKSKLILSFGILIILSFVIVGINFMTYKTLESDANFVNHSGKLRATSYKMAQLSNIIVTSKQEIEIKTLQESIDLFDVILKDISDGNTEKGLEPLTHAKTISQVELITEKWNTKYKEALV